MRNERTKLEHLPPSRQLAIAVKRSFEDRGDTITAYCRCHQLDRGSVRKALIGKWNGPKGCAMRQRVVAAALGKDDG